MIDVQIKNTLFYFKFYAQNFVLRWCFYSVDQIYTTYGSDLHHYYLPLYTGVYGHLNLFNSKVRVVLFL